MDNIKLSEVVFNEIADILKRGNSCEVKKEKDNIVVVEIQRRVRKKASTIG